MIAQVRSLAAARSLAAVLLAGACLAACATPQPRLSARLPEAGPGGRSGLPSGATIAHARGFTAATGSAANIDDANSAPRRAAVSCPAPVTAVTFGAIRGQSSNDSIVSHSRRAISSTACAVCAWIRWKSAGETTCAAIQ